MNRIAAAAVAVAMAAAPVVVVGVGSTGPLGAVPAHAQLSPEGTTSTTGTTGTPTPNATPTASPSPTATKPPACPATVRRTFAPKTIAMAGVVRRATIVTPPRVNHVPGSPPLTSAGKWQVAWDRKWPIRPGAKHGNVLMNAHVWPDGSAIGNRMLAKLQVGDRIVLRGLTKKLCYRVVKKIQVSPREALRRYYRTDGKPRLAIVVCSGRRLGPGVWEKRTIWFAAPRS